jgi:eukaryotic-like serine/threonine-protein kinase
MTIRYGRYETISQIASGGMATVYLGRAVGVGGFERKVAVKVMHDHIADDPDFVAMFLDEARLAARIHHPNVVGTMDVQKTEDAMFLVMEYIEGASLRRALRGCHERDEVMPLPVALRVMIDTLRGLHAAHELPRRDGQALNLVHRDVSPHNILIGVDGISRITDFGVARAEARLSSTRGGQLKGKIAYMPPEQGRGDDVDRRADVYAAGVVFWEMLTGQRLFKAEHDGALVAMILRGCETPPREVNQDLPKEIDALCMKALEIDVDRRFASAADFAEAIEEVAHELSIRIATPRAVARFVDDFKVIIDTDRPPPMFDEDSMESRPIEIDAPITSSIADDPSSQMTGVGTVQSVMLRPSQTGARPRRRYAVIAVVAAALFVVGVVAITSSSGGGSGPAAAGEDATKTEVDDGEVGGTPSSTASALPGTEPSAQPGTETSAQPGAETSAQPGTEPSSVEPSSVEPSSVEPTSVAPEPTATANDVPDATSNKPKGGHGNKPAVGKRPPHRPAPHPGGTKPYGFQPDDL